MDLNNFSRSNKSSILPTLQIHEMISDLVPDIIAEVNIEKKYVWLNKAGFEFYGEDAIGKEASYYFAEEQNTYENVSQIFDGSKELTHVESWQRRKDGEKRLLSWTCKSLKNGKGEIIGALSTAHDITNRYKADEKYKYSEAQLHNALVLARLGPWEYDVPNDMFTFNDTFYSLYHTTVNEMGGYTMSSGEYSKKFVVPEDIPMVGKEVQDAIASKDPNYTREIEHRIIYKDGAIGYITVRFFVTKDAFGNTVKTFGINQDITERKLKEQELEKTKNELTAKISELEKTNNLMINRELKMIELKKEIEDLRKQIAPKI